MPVCDDVSARMISLPLFDTMTDDEVDQVVESLNAVIGATEALEAGGGAIARRAAVPLVYAGISLRSGEITVE